MDNNKLTLGQKLRHRRRALHLTQKKLAEKAGISLSVYGYYERDKSEPTLFISACIADVLDVSLDWLAGRTDKPR